jgi:hypothetical protein
MGGSACYVAKNRTEDPNFAALRPVSFMVCGYRILRRRPKLPAEGCCEKARIYEVGYSLSTVPFIESCVPLM